MRISCVIPCWNQAQYLAEAIESALASKPYEVIVVNDGSPDNTSEVAKKYPVRLIEQVNKGLSSARNSGIMASTGDYIAFLDADDIMHPDYIPEVTGAIMNTGADIIAPSFTSFGVVEPTTTILDSNLTLKDFAEANRVGYFCTIRREALIGVGGYSPKMWCGYEDLHLTFNLLSRGAKIHTIKKPLINYRIKENSMIHDAQKNHKELIAIIDKDFPGIISDKNKEIPLIQSYKP